MKKLSIFLILVLVLNITFIISLINYCLSTNEIKVVNEVVENRGVFQRKAIISLVGDLLYEEPYYNSINLGDDKDLYLSKMSEYFLNDDLTLGNLEVVITDGILEVNGEGYSFCAPQYVGKEIINSGFDVLSTSNNHSNDRGMEGRISTINFFKNNSSVMTVGTYDEKRNIESNVIRKNGIDFGFLSYTYGTNVIVPENYRYSMGFFNDPSTYSLTDEYKNLLINEINLLREKVDCLIVFMHWGNEFTYQPINQQRKMAELLNELGVDIIVGTHSHCIQPIEWIKSSNHNTLVYYSLGNFLSADNDVYGASQTFDNAYQFGLFSQLEVSLDQSNNLFINNINSEPVINYYDINERNFLLIPYSNYSDDYEINHFRYKKGFNKEFINNTYMSVIDEEFR